ncbi:hypothetical protein J4422_04590 [Candidatus Pacearchaeota archaeon]|nr:hypothetical protein [Candidatus Pacearchaeota archaeon]
MRKRLGLDSNIAKAKVLLRRYDGANLASFPRAELESLVGIYYNRIRGRPISEIPDDQLYRIAQRLHRRAHEVVEQENSGLESYFH